MPPLHLFRFQATEQCEIGAMAIYGRPNQIQGFVARGHVTATGDPFLSIVFERPTVWDQLTHATKEQREETQLERFLRDYERSVGEKLATAYERGNDPPDFVVATPDGGYLGMECTQLVYGARVHAWNVAQKLKTTLMAVNRHRLRHLEGQTVYLTANTPDRLPLMGQRGAQDVLAALERFEPISNDFTGPPESLAGTDIVQTFGDYSLTAVPLGEFALTPFVKLMGFDLAFAMQSDVRGSEAWRMLADRVKEKDRAGSRAILVSCGAPVVRGLSFPSDDLAAEAIAGVADENTLAVASHIQTVYVHAWDSQRILRLTPGKRGAEVYEA